MVSELKAARITLAKARATMAETEAMLANVRDLFVGVAAGRGRLDKVAALKLANQLEHLRRAARASLDLIDIPSRVDRVQAPAPPGVM